MEEPEPDLCDTVMGHGAGYDTELVSWRKCSSRVVRPVKELQKAGCQSTAYAAPLLHQARPVTPLYAALPGGTTRQDQRDSLWNTG